MLKYPRILLKLSGEALMGEGRDSVDPETVAFILQQVKDVLELGVKVGIVIGGGNFFRGVAGSDKLGIQRANADAMGMLATVMNGILLRDSFNAQGINAKLFSAFAVGSFIKGYNRDSMIKRLNDGDVVIFVGGTGSPYFTTDSGAALRGLEMNADLLIKATKVDGVYNKDPKKFTDAVKYQQLSFDEAIGQNLGVMDMAAFALCRENNLNIKVCSIFKAGSLKRVVLGEDEGTLVYCK
ncbi:MAG TPA: UMP kinase [Burkholderiales bacterium]|jgi:uridylate kinase|nr:UMP kinase [Burkholderiales bacterium]